VTSVDPFKIIVENAMDGIVLIDAGSRRLQYANAAFCRMLGYALEDIEALSLMDLHPEEDLPRVISEFDRHVEGETENFPVKRKDGSLFHADITVAYFESGGRRYVAGFFRDITERKRVEKWMHTLATTDALTGLANRGEFTRLLEKEMERARRYGSPLSLVMYDLDRFKRVNDEFGHDAGDEVLREVSRVTKESIRSSDVAARWGGEEFMVLTPQSDLAAANRAAEKLREAIARHRFDHVGKVTVSVGVVQFSTDENSPALLKRVDKALYRAKARGRNCVETSA
jgi:diguanylate cyclase (GGDEF)-like protein/PAS domain S-box-containing protein